MSYGESITYIIILESFLKFRRPDKFWLKLTTNPPTRNNLCSQPKESMDRFWHIYWTFLHDLWAYKGLKTIASLVQASRLYTYMAYCNLEPCTKDHKQPQWGHHNGDNVRLYQIKYLLWKTEKCLDVETKITAAVGVILLTCRQVINSHGTVCVKLVDLCLPRGSVSTACAIETFNLLNCFKDY